MKQLLNHRVMIFQEGNYKFEGKIIAEDELFLEIFDEKDQQNVRVNKKSIVTLKVLE